MKKKPKYLELALTDDYRVSIDNKTHKISIKPFFKKDYFRIYVPYDEKSLIYKTFCNSSSPDKSNINILIPGAYKHVKKHKVIVSYTTSCSSLIYKLLCSFKPGFILEQDGIDSDCFYYVDELAKVYKKILDVENIANLIWLSYLAVNHIIIPIPRYKLGKDRIPNEYDILSYNYLTWNYELYEDEENEEAQEIIDKGHFIRGEFYSWRHDISEVKKEYEKIIEGDK